MQRCKNKYCTYSETNTKKTQNERQIFPHTQTHLHTRPPSPPLNSRTKAKDFNSSPRPSKRQPPPDLPSGVITGGGEMGCVPTRSACVRDDSAFGPQGHVHAAAHASHASHASHTRTHTNNTYAQSEMSECENKRVQ